MKTTARILAAIALTLVALLSFVPAQAQADPHPTPPPAGADCETQLAYRVAEVDWYIQQYNGLTYRFARIDDRNIDLTLRYIDLTAVVREDQRAFERYEGAALERQAQINRLGNKVDRKQRRIERLQAKVARLQRQLHSH